MNFTNIGTGWPIYIYIAVALAFLWVLWSIAQNFYQIVQKWDDMASGERHVRIKVQVAKMVVLVVVALALTVGFGKGQPTQITAAEDEGYRKQLAEVKPTPVEEVRAQTEAKKPDVLKAQDRGFEQEAAEADDYIKKALERAETK